MKNTVMTPYLTVACLLATGLATSPVHSEWDFDPAQYEYKRKFGDFPPENIDQKLLENRLIEEPEEIPAAASSAAETTPDNTTMAANQPMPPGQAQAPYYGRYEQNRYDQGRNTRPYGPRPRYNRRSGSSMPWGNSGSSFSGPWNNNRSGSNMPWNNSGTSFSGPWNNNRSGSNMPWNNSGSNFSGPWDNSNTSFSGPWDNNGSSFSVPWGNNRSGSSMMPW